jgi:putative mRNA 3-end processing factor
MTPNWLIPHPHGLYLAPADVWIDPSRAVARALVTHGHADHARPGHGAVLATPQTLAIMAARYGPQAGAQPLNYGEVLNLGGVGVSFHPSGHVLGAAQISLTFKSQRIVVSGDYKRRPDPTAAAFEPVPCDIFITEATFALPVFRHPPIAQEIAKLLSTSAANPDRAILLGAYALGKAQRLAAELRAAGYSDRIYLHGAMTRLFALYEEQGMPLGDVAPVGDLKGEALKGKIVIAPPSALADRWSRRLPDPLTAMASGWMRVRQRAKQRGVELPLIISDHADWDELTGTIAELRPEQVWITHGRDDALAHWCSLRQQPARALALVGREEDGE